MVIDYEKLNKNIHDEGDLRSEFEDFIDSLTAVRYSLERNAHGEYKQAALDHMWIGYCMKAALLI